MKRTKYRWELLKLLRFDNIVTIQLTMKCNQNCWYCCQKYVDHGYHEEKDYLFWIDFIKRKKIKAVSISGGECSIYPGVENIINYCSDNNILVSVVTNLKRLIPGIKKSWKVTFLASYHDKEDPINWMQNYTAINKDFYVTVHELHKNPKKILPFSKLVRPITEWVYGDGGCPYKTYYPDGTLYPRSRLIREENSFSYKLLSFLRKVSNYDKKFN